MALLRWDPWGELAVMQRDMNDLLSRTSGQPTGRSAGLIPPIDAWRTDDGMVVRVELPGVDPDQVEVSVQDNVLTISGERVRETEVADDAWLRRERGYGAFERSFALPRGTDAEAITASFHHGVLELTVPHPPERKPRKIQIGATTPRQTVDVGEHQAS